MNAATESPKTAHAAHTALLLLGIPFLLATPTFANSLAGNAAFGHNISGKKDEETLQLMSQRYATSFSSEVTRAMQLQGNINYNKQWREQKGATESFAPSGRFDLRNDIFSASLYATASTNVPVDAANKSSKTWLVTWASGWQRKFWPTLSLNYGQTAATNDATPPTTDTEDSNLTLTTYWDLLVGTIDYSYNDNNKLNHLSQSETRNSSHMATFKTKYHFWDDLISVNFSQQYSESSNESIHHPSIAGIVEDRIQIAQATAEIPADPTFGSLTPAPALTDNDLEAVAVTINEDDAMNLGIKLNLGQQANRIYLYIDPDATLTAAEVAALRFSLYSSIDGATFWSLETTNLIPTLDVADNRLVINIPTTSTDYLKLVATAWPATDVPVTEMQTYYQYPVGSAGVSRLQKQVNHTTNFALAAKLLDNMPFAYSMALRKSKASEQKNSSLNQTASLKWNLHRYCRPSVNFNETRSQSTNSEIAKSRSFSLSADSTPLPSLDINLNATNSESYLGQTSLATNQSYSLNLAATLYPDLNAALALHRTEAENLQQNSQTGSWETNLTLTSRLSSKLTTSLSASHTINSAEAPGTGETSTESSQADLSLNMRPSDILSLRANAAKEWNAGDSPLSYGLHGTLALLRTGKSQLTTGFLYSKSGDEEAQTSITASWSWLISRFFSFQTNGNYSFHDPGVWNINSQLSTKF